MREYMCFKCNKGFTTEAKAPSCRICGQVLKGRPVGGRSYKPSRNYDNSKRRY